MSILLYYIMVTTKSFDSGLSRQFLSLLVIFVLFLIPFSVKYVLQSRSQ